MQVRVENITWREIDMGGVAARMVGFASGGGSSAEHPETRVKYTEASGITPRKQTFDIVGELASNSIDNIRYVEEVDIGNTVTSIGERAFF